jgi:DinB family protein
MMDIVTDRAALASALKHVRADFHQVLDLVGEDEWDKPTVGTRWTNEELLFHMVFGYMLVQRLLRLVRLFGRLPDWVSRRYATVLNAATPPFDWINFYGSRAAAVVYNRKRMAAKLDRVIDALQRSLAREDEGALHRGMHFPVRWDPYFQDYMTLADVYHYPGEHYDHHRRQLTLANLTRRSV